MMRHYYAHAGGARRIGRAREDEAVRDVLHSRRSQRLAAAHRNLSREGHARTSSTWWTPSSATNRCRRLKKVQLITDGACLGNPGPGGWAASFGTTTQTKEIWGSEPHTTNNRMELTAAIEGLTALREPCEVEMVTDSDTSRTGSRPGSPAGSGTAGVTADKKPW